ncbi:unnamed protein product [Cyprideis torosa]|uniref:Uncharacterized protein n=1 Tax=Cyprideis torosa TaxID=163714 RepID=A0A7R8ZNM0_9CRUS|nr:unnamed protein product [Cyprideis torosa]CAG0891921.1 unnamed protein product [Cyprideis torosa]
MSDTNSCGCEGSCHQPSSTTQTLTELDFSRGIWQAVVDGDIKAVQKCLTKKSVDVNVRDTGGYTPLHYSVVKDQNIDITRLLLENGADVNAATRSGGATPLHRAVLKSQLQTVKLLMEHDADAKARNNDGLTPVDMAKSAPHSVSILNLLTS